MVFLFGVVFTLIEGPGLGWANPRVIAMAVVALLAFVAFLRYEAKRHDPFIDLRFFRSIPFASATADRGLRLLGVGRVPLHDVAVPAVRARLLRAMHTGLIYLPIAIGALVFSPISGRHGRGFGARPVTAGGRAS